MKNDRRHFLKTSLFGSAMVAAGCMPDETESDRTVPAPSRPLRILVLGGTGFIGPHMVREALRRGHSVELFNRGRTNNELFPDLKLYKGDRDGGLGVLEGGEWDVVVDNSGYVPRHVEDSARLLAPVVSHYLYISTISVYGDFSGPIDEDTAVGTLEDESVEEVTGETYGPLKALCERRVLSEIGQDRTTILRPTYICGPGDRTDRFTYWPVRTMRGGDMLWPGTPEDDIQIIDVRDLQHGYARRFIQDGRPAGGLPGGDGCRNDARLGCYRFPERAADSPADLGGPRRRDGGAANGRRQQGRGGGSLDAADPRDGARYYRLVEYAARRAQGVPQGRPFARAGIRAAGRLAGPRRLTRRGRRPLRRHRFSSLHRRECANY